MKKQYAWQCTGLFFFGALLAFGLYQVHDVAAITEGGVLGAVLLLSHLFRLSPALSGFFLNALCYLFAYKRLGWRFILYSAVSAVGFSASYAVFECFPPLWPALAAHPLLASFFGALFVGIGAGGAVRLGGAPSGDDALAMAVSDMTSCKIEWVYLATDLLVLSLSLLYIPLTKIMYSVLTVLLSGKLIGIVERVPLPRKKKAGD